MNIIRVVLIGGQELSRTGLIAALQMSDGIEVVGDAACGGEGLKIVKETQPDVAILTIALPDMEGIELTNKLKQLQNNSEEVQTKILVLTTQDNDNSVMAAFAAGADSYALSDVSFNVLLQAIQVTSQGNNWIDPSVANIIIEHSKKLFNAHTNKFQDDENTIEINKVGIKCSSEEYQHRIEIEPLTQRELEVLDLIVAGCSNSDIAEKLYITVGTVKTHVRSILSKLCVNDRTQAAVQALRSGLVS
ncbi:MAG: response regulator transcription factor [Cyanobacteriota bacterium]|nr:response regulator transcription factor [Cyanobacteriota bacterium]